MTDAMPLPPAMARRAREFSGTPVPARPAATVVLLRPADHPPAAASAGRPTGVAAPGRPHPDQPTHPAASSPHADPAAYRPDAGTPSAPGTASPSAPGTASPSAPSMASPGAPGMGAAGGDGFSPAFEAYVLRRAMTMTFGGVYAFPGGGVDPSDRPETIRTDWAERLGLPEEQARAVVGAAARELFEEAGVLLAGPDANTGTDPAATVGGLGTPDWEADRLALERRELTMTELLSRRGLRLRDDLLLPWARWITPEFEPRRFDTWFFVALLPGSQTARDVSGEADRTAWIAPASAGELPMLPPTRLTLRQLATHPTVPDVVAASAHRDAATPVMPRVLITEDGAVLRIPLD